MHKRPYEPYAREQQQRRRSDDDGRRRSGGDDRRRGDDDRRSSAGHASPAAAAARTKELPLRLWADAGGHARALCGQHGEKVFVLGVSASASAWTGSGAVPNIALILGSGSVAAIVCDAPEPPAPEQLCGLLKLPPTTALPSVLLRRCEEDDRPYWHSLQQGSAAHRLSLEDACASARGSALVEVGAAFAECMVDSIRSYYFRQVQEPSVKGFLSLLENAIFPRNDLYLFELLQNAVDDEASVVRFEAMGSTLQIWHDGREFSPLDVFGLSSVGFSAKSGRTIGFMGVGFKAVYKRYGRVRVRDRTWAFKFEEPSADERAARRGDGSAANGWVLMPNWDTSAKRAAALESGCEFSLELPRGGRAAIAQDLAVLPHTLPPLLGRTAQIGQAARAARGAEIAPFSLTWGPRSLKVRLDSEYKFAVGDNSISGQAQMVRVAAESGQEQHWMFVTRSFRQDSAAIEAFAQHTRKTYPSDQQEEFCVFFEVDDRGLPKPPTTQTGASRSRNGVIHSTLPTKLFVPMGAHVQSSWLLSIDRMDVQALTDNAWNAGLLNQLPRVCVLLLRWIAATHSGDISSSKSRFTVLPRMTRSERGNLTVDVLETAVDASIVEKAVRNERLVPIIGRAKPSSDMASNEPPAPTDTVQFVRAQQAIKVPDSFFAAGLSSAELEQWLLLPPLATPALGSFASSPLWDCLPQLDGRAMRSCATNLATMLNAVEGSTARATKSMQILAAFADEGLGPAPEEGADQGQLPKFEVWPIFLTREGSCVTASQLRWPDDDFWRAPMAIQQLLEPHILPPRPAYSSSAGRGGKYGAKGRAGKHSKQQAKPVETAQGHLLDSTLQRLLQTPPAGGNSLRLGVWKSSVTCVNEAKKSGSTIVEMDGIVKRFFEARAALRGEELKRAMNEVITVTAWAQQRRMGHRVSHVLVGDETSLRLVQPRKVYIGSPYTETKLAELAGDDVPCVSACYDQASGLSVSTPGTRHWRDFFLSIGCNEGVRFEPRASTLQRNEHQQLADGKVPALRKSQKQVVMPYGLGTMNSRQLMVIDVDLSEEWQQLLRQLGSRASVAGEESVACNTFTMMLSRLTVDIATHPDAKTTPAVGPAIAGRESDPAAASMSLIPTRRRLLYLPPGQPGALLMDMGPAQWVKRISAAAWVSTERGSKRPAQVSLWTDKEKGYRPGMPMVSLPDDVLRALKASKMAAVLGFGTADPPKAMERLREVAGTMRNHSSSVPAEPACTDEELCEIWRGICMSEKQGKLSGSERHELNKLVTQLPLLPGLASSSGSRVLVSRCVTAPKADRDTDSSNASSDAMSDMVDTQLVESMCLSGFLVDVSHPSWALVGCSDTLISLLGIRGVVKTTELGAFLGWVCDAQPSMTPILRDGLTIATHRVLQQIRPRGGRSGDTPSGSAALASVIGCPLKIFCTNGPSSLQSCWRLLEGDDVRPVVNDDAEKAGMLEKEHGFQFAGMYDHSAPGRSEPAGGIASTLHAMDKQIIAKLHIPFLSSSDFSVRIQTRGEGEALEDVQVRLSYVLSLLKEWCTSVGLSAMVDSLVFEVKSVKRFKQIVKTFTVPGTAPIKSSVWAVWRRSGAVLLCGDAEDYVAELQTEVYQRIASHLAGGSNTRLYPGKVLNLLGHLEVS
jgi:hypothetical protein